MPAMHPGRDLRGRRRVVEAPRGGRARAPVYALDRGRPRVHIHPERGASPRFDGMLRHGRPLPCLWHGTRAGGFQTIPLWRIAQPTWPKKANSMRGPFLVYRRTVPVSGLGHTVLRHHKVDICFDFIIYAVTLSRIPMHARKSPWGFIDATVIRN